MLKNNLKARIIYILIIFMERPDENLKVHQLVESSNNWNYFKQKRTQIPGDKHSRCEVAYQYREYFIGCLHYAVFFCI